MTKQQPGEASTAALRGLELLKGHSTGKDFLLLIDPDCQVSLTSGQVASICNRRTGIGADGFVRVARTSALPGAEAFAKAVPEAQWFMDCYQADGSVAEICGNDSELFAHVLDAEGLCPIPDGGSLIIATRSGARAITRAGELWTVDMGSATLRRPEGAVADASLEGWDTLVELPGLDGHRAALSLSLPTAHVVVALADEAELDSVDFAGLTGSETLDLLPVPPDGSNLDVVVPLGADEEDGALVGRARVRSLEHGVGEAQSSGTGCCAVAVALHEWEGEGAPQDYLLEVPGGSLGVHVGTDPWAPGATVLLTGPAQITGRITLA
ncbi:Diaminopimelate epimerase [Actinomyces bovis]|uniref:Diaminopimelate epimerase n=1 Tax=Actinomyces bovis TaxID=1658 RepID=A0ABY1VP65_9ACTO|nr:diaminopimelate epimerase [Actinomyces bovis]SPT53906.1 Diaminopimelate epimerase [Actinomyces bovis]VEG53358.1 Diaminopimelate epimerase [Actinomyces israelii]